MEGSGPVSERYRFCKLAKGKRKRCDIIAGNPDVPPKATYDKTGFRGSTGRVRLRRRRHRARDDALAVASAERTTAVAEDAGSLRPRRPPVSRLSRGALGRAGDAFASCSARGDRRQGLHGDAARTRYRRPFADAGARRFALVRALPRTGRQG